jgi:hypothetical protein
MQLYIKYIDEQIVDHPMLEENLKQVDPTFNSTNLPDTLKLFERINSPVPGPYARVENSYQLCDDGIVRDVYTVLDISDEEKSAIIAHTRSLPHPNGWVFNETNCSWEPGVSYPTDGKVYSWSEELENWREIIPVPVPVSTPATA